MASNTSPIFPAAPAAYATTVSAANTARDGTGTLSTLASGGDNGARVDRVIVSAKGTTHDGMVRFFVTTGEATYLVHEVPVTAATPTATTRVFTAEWGRTDGNPVALLGPSDTLQVATHVADLFSVVAWGGGY